MAKNNDRLLNKSGVKAIMSKRITVPATAVGRKVVFLVQGNGNTIDVLDKAKKPVLSTIKGQEGVLLRKTIFNLRANSAMAQANARNRQYMIDALKAENAGDEDKADELYNDYLNACQMSFGIINGSQDSVLSQLGNNVQIEATVVQVDTENGSLLTIDPSTISFPKAEVYGATSFNLDEFIETVEPAKTKGRKTKTAVE